jgi:biotin carboxyl carrier protein
MPYYPETRVIKGLARIVRERRLPAHAAPRAMAIPSGMAIEAVQTVLQGDVLRDFRIIDVAAYFKERDAERAARWIEVHEGDRVTAGQTLAQKGKGRRARTLNAPSSGVVARIDGARLILQVADQSIDLLAKIPGEMTIIEPHAVQVTGIGALIQCMWGNGGYAYATIKPLPEDGYAALSKLDVRISEYRNVAVFGTEPLTKGDLLVAQQQALAGVIAPSMPSALREFAQELPFPVLLTEGFGQSRPTELIYRLLQSNMGRQAALDAAIPDPWSPSRPEIMIPLPTGGALPSTPSMHDPLAVGTRVRLTRAPWNGLTGEVVELPAAPQLVESGLRVPCARVRVGDDGQIAVVPLANLEMLG